MLKRLMSRRPVCVDMDDDLAVVKQLFDQQHFHHLLVTEKRRLVGIVSDRDLFKALSPRVGTPAETAKDSLLMRRPVHQIMTRQPRTLTADAKIYTAVELFNDARVSCIPIVDEQGHPIGVLSWRDIMKELGQRRMRQQGLNPEA